MLRPSLKGAFLFLIYFSRNDRSWFNIDLYHAQSHHIILEEALGGYGGSKVPEKIFVKVKYPPKSSHIATVHPFWTSSEGEKWHGVHAMRSFT